MLPNHDLKNRRTHERRPEDFPARGGAVPLSRKEELDEKRAEYEREKKEERAGAKVCRASDR